MRVLQILLRTTLCAPFLSPSSQARVTLGIAVVDSTSVFISSLQWSQRISTIQLGICLLPNLNVVSWDDKTEPNLKNMSIFNNEKKLSKWISSNGDGSVWPFSHPGPSLPSSHCHTASVAPHLDFNCPNSFSGRLRVGFWCLTLWAQMFPYLKSNLFLTVGASPPCRLPPDGQAW